MPYTPITWVDEIPAESPEKYVIIDSSLGEIASSATIELATAPGTPGTPVNAPNLNHLEQGLVDVEQATVPAILTAKGDLITASAAETAEILGVGTPGTYLIPDSAEAGGLKWAQMVNFGAYTSVNWNNTAKSAADYDITAETEFSIPAGVKMILLNMTCWWASHTDWETALYVGRPAGGTTFLSLEARGTYVNTKVLRVAGWVPLDTNGQFRVSVYETAAGGVTLTIPAFML